MNFFKPRQGICKGVIQLQENEVLHIDVNVTEQDRPTYTKRIFLLTSLMWLVDTYRIIGED